MTPEGFVIGGGVLAAVFAVFHVLFWKLFRWKEELAKLSFLNRAVMQILNLCLTLVFAFFAYVSLAHATELVTTELGRTLLLFVSLFWYARAAMQIVFFGLRHALSFAFFAVFVLGGTLYAAPFFAS